MAYNVPAIETFVGDINAAINDLIQVREDLDATDRLWPSLDANSKTAVRAQISNKLAAAKAAIQAISVP